MMDISLIYRGSSFLKKICEYLRLIDSVSNRISRLEKMHQRSAKESFEMASRTTDTSLQRHYILRAIDKYNDAIGVEKDDDAALFGIYVGLSCCHSILDDVKNRNAAISEALNCYERIYQESTAEPLDLIDEQSGYDNNTRAVLNFIYGVTTLGVGNLVNEGIKQISLNRINKKKEIEKEIRPIANQIKLYIS